MIIIICIALYLIFTAISLAVMYHFDKPYYDDPKAWASMVWPLTIIYYATRRLLKIWEDNKNNKEDK